MTKLDEFLQLAEQKVGTDGSWSWGKCNANKNTPWSANFVSACAKSVGATSILPITTKAQDVADLGMSKVQNPGEWVSGNTEKGTGKPQAGDIVLFNWDSNGNNRADSVGIVKKYDTHNNKIIVISGDSRKAGENRSIVGMETYGPNNNCIKGYFRPDWSSLE